MPPRLRARNRLSSESSAWIAVRKVAEFWLREARRGRREGLAWGEWFDSVTKTYHL